MNVKDSLRPKSRRMTKKAAQMAPYLETRVSSKKRDESHPSHPSLPDMLELHKLELCPQPEDNAGESPCVLLQVLKLSYNHTLKVLVCWEHGTFLPLDSLLSHLYTRHSFKFTPKKKEVLSDMVAHLALVFGNNIWDSLKTLIPNLPNALEAPLTISSEAKTIRYRFQCHIPKCGKWISRNESYRGCPETEFLSHLVDDHQENKRPNSIYGAWCQHIAFPRRLTSKRQKYHIFQLLGYKPPPELETTLTPSFPTKTEEAPSYSDWPNQLKWPLHRTKLLKVVSHTILRDLVLPPSKQLAHTGSNKHIERGLLLIRKELTRYLVNGQLFIASLHGSYKNFLRPK
jgi:hypothetical protein